MPLRGLHPRAAGREPQARTSKLSANVDCMDVNLPADRPRLSAFAMPSGPSQSWMGAFRYRRAFAITGLTVPAEVPIIAAALSGTESHCQ